MDITTHFADIQSCMNDELNLVSSNHDELRQDGHRLRIVRHALQKLKSFCATYNFKSTEEEIIFFKTQKPLLLSQYVYRKKLFELKLDNSFRDTKSKKTNYQKILKQMGRYAKEHRKIYEYWVSDATHCDQIYFVRINSPHVTSLKNDNSFTTGYDEIIGRILGYEHLKKFISEQYLNPAHTRHVDLIWTASKTDLIELIYALQAAKVFNNGNADVKLIAKTLSQSLDVTLYNVYKTFQEIKLRKRDITPFLDGLKKKLSQKITESDV